MHALSLDFPAGLAYYPAVLFTRRACPCSRIEHRIMTAERWLSGRKRRIANPTFPPAYACNPLYTHFFATRAAICRAMPRHKHGTNESGIRLKSALPTRNASPRLPHTRHTAPASAEPVPRFVDSGGVRLGRCSALKRERRLGVCRLREGATPPPWGGYSQFNKGSTAPGCARRFRQGYFPPSRPSDCAAGSLSACKRRAS